MSIAPPVGAMSAYLSKLISSRSFMSLRDFAAKMAKRFPRRWSGPPGAPRNIARHPTGGTLFEELGFYYVGPIDGHNLDHLLPVLRNLRDLERPSRCCCMSSRRRARAMPRPKRRRTNITASPNSTSSPASRKRPHPARRLIQCVRQGADRRGRGQFEDRRGHRRHAVGHRTRQVRPRISRAHVRCRHRRAACRHLRRRHGDRGAGAVLRHLFHLPAARLRPGGA